MRVKELIKILEEFDGDRDVAFYLLADSTAQETVLELRNFKLLPDEARLFINLTTDR